VGSCCSGHSFNVASRPKRHVAGAEDLLKLMNARKFKSLAIEPREMPKWNRFAFLVAGLVTFTTACFAQSQTAKPKEELCTISGIVITRTDSGPLKGAMVQLTSDVDKEHTIVTKTAADGRFELRNVSAGQYHLKVTRNGFVEQEYGQKKPGDPGITFTLRLGQTMSDLIFKLSRAAVITGRIYDDDGEPMAMVSVTAVREVYKEGQKQLETAAFDRSNDLGEYRLYGLSPGRYFVSAQNQQWNNLVGDPEFSTPKKNGGERGYTKIYYPSGTEPGKASSISVKEGEEIPSVDILMKEVTVYRIRGKVINLVSTHKGRETALEIMRRGQNVEWDFVGGRNVAKLDGAFEIPEIVPGEYTIMAFLYDEGKGYSTQEDVDVVNSDVDGLTLTIAPGVNIPGRILWEGKPSVEAEGVRIIAAPLQSGSIWGGEAHVEANNEFTVKEVPQGTFRLEVSGIGKDCYIQEVRHGESVLSDTVFRVARGSAIGLEITVNCRSAHLEGTVLNEENLPVAGVWVVAIPEGSKRKLHRLFKSMATDQYGRFDLRGLANGKYKLFSWDGIEPGAWEDESFLKGVEEQGVSIEVKEGDARALELKLIRVKDLSAKSE
jgi:hypothetical protein